MNFATVLTDAAPAAANAAPTDYNGHLTTIDVAHPQVYINIDNKMIQNADGSLNVRDTMAYYMFVAGGRANIDVTSSAVENSIKKIGRLISIHSVLSICSNAGLTIAIRSSDMYTAVELTAMLGDKAAGYRTAADKVYAFLTTNEVGLARITSDSRLVVLSFIATAIHREKHDGHNWFTDKTTSQKTETSRCLAVAGDLKHDFGEYMRVNGHDGTHFLTDACLKSIASALTGQMVPKLRIAGAYAYNGVSITGRTVDEVIDVGDAARDRWPVGQLGVASVAKGCDAINIMITDIASKVTVSNAAQLTAGVNARRAAIVDVTGTAKRVRADFLVLKNQLVTPIVVAYGYVQNAPGLRDVLGDSEALNSLAKSHATEAATGAVIATRMRDVTADTQAVGNLVASALNVIAAALAAGSCVVDPLMPIVTKNAVDSNVDFKVKESARKASVVTALEKIGTIDEADIRRLNDL